MALIKNNTRALCLAALVMMSATSLLSCHAAGTNTGPAAAPSAYDRMCFRFSNCERNPDAAEEPCRLDCKFFGYDKSYCVTYHGGICCCHS